MQLNVFAFREVFLSWYSQTTWKEFEQIGLQNTKNMWRENVLAHAHLWREVHKSNIRVTRQHTKYKILNYIMKHNFCSSNLLTKSNRTTLQSYKVEERTFRTHCTAKRAAVRKIQNLVIKELRIFLPERNLQRVRNFNKEE